MNETSSQDQNADTSAVLQVASILDSARITFDIRYVGESRCTDRGENWHHDKWDATLSNGNDSVVFDYSTGIGLRDKAAPPTGGPYTPGTVAWERWQATRKPVPPSAEDVLRCLVEDTRAARMTFDEWCDTLGYDNDSRKAEAAYRACQATHDKLRRLMRQGDIDALSEALADC